MTTPTTNAKCPSCAAEKVDVKGRGHATCTACGGGFNPLPLAFATLKRAGIDGAKLQSILGTEGKKVSKCVSCNEMFTTFPVLGETLHACVPCQAVWLAKGAMERFHRVAVGAGKDQQPVSTATMQMAVANIAPPSEAKPAPPPAAAPPAAPPAPAAPAPAAPAAPAASAGFEKPPSTLMMASAAPGSAEPSVASQRPVIEASLDPPVENTDSAMAKAMAAAAASLDPPAPKPRVEPKPVESKPEPKVEPPRPIDPPKRTYDPLDPPSAKSGGGLDPIVPPGSASTMKSPPTSKPFNLTSGAPPADPKDKPAEKTGETKKAALAAEKAAAEKAAADKTGETKKKDKTGEHKKPAAADSEKKKVANAPVLYVDEGSGGMYKAAAALLVVLIGAFFVWRIATKEPETPVGSGKLVRFGADSGAVAKGEELIGKRLAIKHVLERPKGDLTVWFVPGGGGVEGAGGEALLAEIVGKDTRLQEPRTFGGLTTLNGTLKQGEKGGRLRAFFTVNDAWVLTAMSTDAAFAESPEAERFLASLHDAD